MVPDVTEPQLKPILLPGADDIIQPFQLAGHVRGRLVRLGGSVDSVLRRHDYPRPVASLLGEALVLTLALASGLKYDGVFTLQTKGDGPVRMLVADVTSAGKLRGYAEADADGLAKLLDQTGNPSFARLVGAGHLAFTVDQGPATERYQGIVDLAGSSLADCIHHYFRQSEQIEVAVKAAVRAPASSEEAWRAGAILIQRLPAAERVEDPDSSDEWWRRAAALMASSTADELTDGGLPALDLLFRLFHEDGVEIFPARPVSFGCRCSRERVAAMLAALPAGEVASLSLDGRIEVTCEFCNSRYEFSPGEIHG